jgi:hypothetical protein
MLKKNAWLKGPPSMCVAGPASASGPHARNNSANSRFSTMYSSVTTAMNPGHEIDSSR